jgi:hypothetical protein
MIIYSTTLWFKNDEDLEKIFGVAASWLSRKSHEKVQPAFLKASNQRIVSGGNRINTLVAGTDFPKLWSVRYTERDKEVPGRQWITEIGINQETSGSEIECSVLLRTDEISTRVDVRTYPTVPYFIHDLVKKCSLSPHNCRASITMLDNESETVAFSYAIDFPERQHPLILISPTNEGIYLVDISRLRFLVEGLAEIVQIPVGVDTYRIAELLGDQYAAWRGAVNLIFPEVHSGNRKFVPTKKLLPDEIQEMIHNGFKPAEEILSMITHRTNLLHSRHHISPEKVLDVHRQRELRRSRKQANETGQLSDYISLLEGENEKQRQRTAELQQKIDSTQAEIDFLYSENRQLEDEKRQLRFDNESLKANFGIASSKDKRWDISDIQKTFDEVSKNLTPRESLAVLSKLFPERVEILDTAWKSAKDSDKFKEKRKLFELLWKLQADYWGLLMAGKGDAEARIIFGDDYSAKESESAEGNKRARQLRTFNYNGQKIEMMKHLKIGVKPSPAETIRIHFEWLADEQKIVIGYCGPHLDHK